MLADMGVTWKKKDRAAQTETWHQPIEITDCSIGLYWLGFMQFSVDDN